MLASLRAEALKIRRLWLWPIALGGGLTLALLVGLSLFSAATRVAGEQQMEMPWQAGLVGDVTVSVSLLLPTLVILITALCFFVEHRGDMWKQLRATPVRAASILAAKFAVIQLLTAAALVVALVVALLAWPLVPDVLRGELGVSGGEARLALIGLAAALYVSLLPVAAIQFVLSARMPNILHPVGIGLAATFACLLASGPTNAAWLPYAYPGAAVMHRFAPRAAPSEQTADPDYRPPAAALAGIEGGGPILIDSGHRNRHGLSGDGAPGSLDWMASAAAAARVPTRVVAGPLTSSVLSQARLLVIAGASRPLAPNEVDAVEQWLRSGGSLLLLTDHEPFATPAGALCRRLGVYFSGELVRGSPGEPGARIRFRRSDGTLPSNALTAGVETVLTYGGQALRRGGPETIRLLPLRSREVDSAHLLAFPFGRGRVVVSGETGLFTAQRHADGSRVGVADRSADNERFVLNLLRWLLRSSGEASAS